MNVENSSKSIDLHELTRNCTKVVEHLESRHDDFVQGPKHSDIDWVIQNAQLVLQYAQLQAGEKSRDESMADNVKWIADHSPNAKIVLWAHNGHVSRSSLGLGFSMGRCLREAFGAEFMNFGFAFNQGSFRAVGGSLREFTAPADSFDGALAATGIPLMALDLRAAPREGAVGQWLYRPHASRSIGAIYSAANASGYWRDEPMPEAFDAILYVDKTSASRGLPDPPRLIANFEK